MSEIASKRKYDNEDLEAYIREHEDIQPDEDYEMNLKRSDGKRLWGKSGGKCAKCKRSIFQKEESDTNIGEECHISSHKPDFPSKEFSRYNQNLTEEQRDKSYDNAILLCGNCHTIIDDPKNTQFTIEELCRIKERHEAEVNSEESNEKDNEKLEQEHDKELIYKWLYDNTEEHKGYTVGGRYTVDGYSVGTLNDPRFRSTEEIASNVHMLSKKVKDLCETNEKLTKMTHDDLYGDEKKIVDDKLLERWAIKEFVNRSST